MPRTYYGGELPDYYIVDSDSHVDETKCELWRRFPPNSSPSHPENSPTAIGRTGTLSSAAVAIAPLASTTASGS